jgi:hypothetical protein
MKIGGTGAKTATAMVPSTGDPDVARAAELLRCAKQPRDSAAPHPIPWEAACWSSTSRCDPRPMAPSPSPPRSSATWRTALEPLPSWPTPTAAVRRSSSYAEERAYRELVAKRERLVSERPAEVLVLPVRRQLPSPGNSAVDSFAWWREYPISPGLSDPLVNPLEAAAESGTEWTGNELELEESTCP